MICEPDVSPCTQKTRLLPGLLPVKLVTWVRPASVWRPSTMHSRTPLARIWGVKDAKFQCSGTCDPWSTIDPTMCLPAPLSWSGWHAMKHAALPLPWTKKEQPFPGFSWSVGGTSRNLRTTGIHWGRWYPTDPSMKTIRWDLHPAQVDVLVLNVSWQPADLAFLNGPQTGIRGIHRSKLGTLIIRWLIRTKHILKSVVP